jgi:hypothetical protein
MHHLAQVRKCKTVAHLHTNTHMHTSLHARTPKLEHMHKHTHIHARTQANTHTPKLEHIHQYTPAYMRTHTSKHTYTHMCVAGHSPCVLQALLHSPVLLRHRTLAYHADLHLPRSKGSALVFTCNVCTMHHANLDLSRSKESALVCTMLMFAPCTMLTWIYLAEKVVRLFTPC